MDGWDELLEIMAKLGGFQKRSEAQLSTIGPKSGATQGRISGGHLKCYEAVTISWNIMELSSAPSLSRRSGAAPWYHRKLADGIYLWHGYKSSG